MLQRNGNGRLKIAVIGGGSTYTPELIEGFLAHREELPVGEVWLMDLPEAKEKLGIVTGLALRMCARHGRPFTIRETTDRRAALDGADFVVTQMRVGQLEARIRDERIPLRHGVIGQETTGPGGFANALRTIPVALEICHDMAGLAPEAWLINFANPSGLVTEAMIRYTKIKAIGLCNVPLNMQAGLAKAFGVDPAEIYVEFAGCNHLVWANRVFRRGMEVTEEAIRLSAEDPAFNMKNIPSRAWSRDFLLSLGAIPCGYHRYYYLAKEILAEILEAEAAGRPTRGEVVRQVEAELLRLYQDPSLDSKPGALAKRGGALYSEAAVRLISSLYNDRRDIQCVDTTNQGALADLPHSAVVEVNCVITAQGPRPIAVGHLRPQLRGLLQQVKAYEELTVEAAVAGDRRLALQALAAHPLVPSVSVARALLEDILAANRDFLPQFAF